MGSGRRRRCRLLSHRRRHHRRRRRCRRCCVVVAVVVVVVVCRPVVAFWLRSQMGARLNLAHHSRGSWPQGGAPPQRVTSRCNPLRLAREEGGGTGAWEEGGGTGAMGGRRGTEAEGGRHRRWRSGSGRSRRCRRLFHRRRHHRRRRRVPAGPSRRVRMRHPALFRHTPHEDRGPFLPLLPSGELHRRPRRQGSRRLLSTRAAPTDVQISRNGLHADVTRCG